jgi:protease-4
MAEQSRPNILVRLIRGLWGGFNFVRRLVFGVIALVLLLGVLAGLAGSVPALREKTALVIAPRGAIVEQYSASPTDRAIAQLTGDEIHETQLRDILRALDAAASDPLIDRVVLVPDELYSAGMSTLLEVGAALDRFRESGKEVIAYGDWLEQRGYLLAAHADKVYLHPEGGIILEGLGRYRTYLKGAFDKLGIEVKLFRVGEYKSAGERYVRTDQSPEAREADLYWMGDLWKRYLDEVVRLRKVDAAKLASDIDAIDQRIAGAQGDLAKLALDQGLVDEIRTRDEVRALLIEKGAEDEENHTFRQVDLQSYLNAVRLRDIRRDKTVVAVVVAEGEIVDGEQPQGMVGGDSTAMLIRKARDDEKVKAVVLRVNSPGGGVFPSELIRREVELTKKAGKPVVVSMGDVAASGGYWISMDADQIIASPSTITGSIGIFGLWFNVPQTMDKLGLSSDGSATTWLSGAFNPTEPYDERVGAILQSVLDRGYKDFIGKVAEARGKKAEEIDKIARGRVWSGAQAHERGLVDRLGTFEDALDEAARRGGLGDAYAVSYVEKDLSAFERFLMDMSGSAMAAWAQDAGVGLPAAWVPPRVARDLEAARRVVMDAITQRPIAIYAHCDCGGG